MWYGVSKMEILHLSTYCNENNKEFPHIFLHENMLEMGWDSRIVCLRGDYEGKAAYKLDKNALIRKKVNSSRIVRKVIFGLGSKDSYYYYPEWNLDRVSYKEILKEVDFMPQYIFVYWNKFSFNQKLLYELQRETGAKIIYVPLDMALFTGGCHYSLGCKQYESGCGNCPALIYPTSKYLAKHTFNYKKKYVELSDIEILSGSEELSEQIRNSALLKEKNLYEFILGQDEEIFSPVIDTHGLKKKYGLNSEAYVIFFGATNLEVKRKGMKYLLEALEYLKDLVLGTELESKIELIVAGNTIEDLKFPFKYTYTGFLSDKRDLAELYQIADVFVSPSIEDSGPLMVNQSILSGTPVVSFDIGIAKSLVINGETGHKVPVKESFQLAEGIFSVLTSPSLPKMKENCRKLGMEKLSKKSTRKTLIDLFDNKFN